MFGGRLGSGQIFHQGISMSDGGIQSDGEEVGLGLASGVMVPWSMGRAHQAHNVGFSLAEMGRFADRLLFLLTAGRQPGRLLTGCLRETTS